MEQKRVDADLDESVTHFLAQLKGGDAGAAQPLWDRYYSRLVALARKKLGDLPRRSVDEEDVMVSAFDTFCRRAQAGNFPDLRDRDGLWPLLALITARKAAKHRKREGRAKRGGGRQPIQPDPDASGNVEMAPFVSAEPSPEEAAIFLSELERFLNSLDDPTDRQILLGKLE
jgi:DNA-directed RNA polymerase specialized sigma24 family protein